MYDNSDFASSSLFITVRIYIVAILYHTVEDSRPTVQQYSANTHIL